MKKTALGIILFTVLNAAFGVPEGFTSLFDGVSLDGWCGATGSYEVVEGTIRCRQGQRGTLFTENVYSDFIMEFEFMLPPGGNNGLAVRYPGVGDPSITGLCELQVLDNTAGKYAGLDARQYHGSAYGMVAAKRGFLNPVGAWNFQRVEVTGSRVKVELNGETILDADLSEVTEFMKNRAYHGRGLKEGHLGLAGHRDPVAFRNLYIRVL